MSRTQLNKVGHPVRFALAGLAALACSTTLSAAQAGEQAFTLNADDAVLEWGACPDFMPEGCGIAVLQGDPGGHNADVFFRLPAGTTADRHWHTSSERMVLVSGEMEVAYDGQDPVTLQPGTYAYGPAELPHSAECRSTEPCVLYITFKEPLDAMPGAPE